MGSPNGGPGCGLSGGILGLCDGARREADLEGVLPGSISVGFGVERPAANARVGEGLALDLA